MRSGRESVDLLVVGGGVNGAGIARDAAGRGMSVLLCEQADLGSATSSASTKLIHGGLRYLEHYEFRLVREALLEREVLLRAAPHIIWPLRFMLPHDGGMRPAWMLRLGLFLYDHLGGRERLPPSQSLDLTRHPAGRALAPGFTKGFEYSDCWVEDSRLVVLNAMDARERGARVMTRTRCVRASRDGAVWRATLEDLSTGETTEVEARGLVNAAGPWVADVLNRRIGANTKHSVRLVKGSHVVVPRAYEGDHAYIFQNEDRRIVFAIPYERRFTLIGTTDVEYVGEPGKVEISAEETAYLCRAVSRYLRQEISPEDVVWSYSGVRPLQDDEEGEASKVTRDYVLELDAPAGQPPLLSIFGGKITTFRRLSEQAVDTIAAPLGNAAGPWTADAPLPGGDMPGADFDSFLMDLGDEYPWLPAGLLLRYARAYGTRTRRMLGDGAEIGALGRRVGGDVYEVELAYARAEEFARTGEDFLWRRSKRGLHLGPDERAAVSAWFDGAAALPAQGAAAGGMR